MFLNEMVFLKERKKDDGVLTRQASDTPKDTPKEACRACGSVHLISGTFSLHPAQEAVQAIIVGYEAGEAALSGKKTALCPPFYTKNGHLSRQARDKHRESSTQKKETTVFSHS